MLQKFSISFSTGADPEEVIAESFHPAGGKIYFKWRQAYVAMYPEEEVNSVKCIGAYTPQAPDLPVEPIPESGE